VQKLLDEVVRVAREAGQMARAAREIRTLQVMMKSSPQDLVTEVDREIEAHVVERLSRILPEAGFLAEEGTVREGSDVNLVWVIDPIDGTMNYIHHGRFFCTSIALVRDGVPVLGVIYDPIHEEMFTAMRGAGARLNGYPLSVHRERRLHEALLATNMLWTQSFGTYEVREVLGTLLRRSRGIRSLGAAALEIAYVASGRFDAYLSMRLSPWDFAAGVLLVEEAGGVATDFYGGSLDVLRKPSAGFLVAAPRVGEDIAVLFAEAMRR